MPVIIPTYLKLKHAMIIDHIYEKSTDLVFTKFLI